MDAAVRRKTLDAVVTVTMNTAIDRVIEVPGFAVGRHLPGKNLVRQPAGKGLNVSRALEALGVASVATGFVGRAELADFEASAPPSLLNAQFLTTDGPTRENVTILDPESATETHIRTTGFSIAPRDVERLAKKLNLLARPGTLAVFAGSLPPGFAAAALVDMVEVLLAGGAEVAVDCAPEALRQVMDKRLWLIKCNRAELADAVGSDGDDEEWLVSTGRQLSSSARTVIVTCGAAGGYAFIDGAAFMVQTDLGEDAAVSTVGCGDALLAGFIAAQLKGNTIRDSYACAAAVASAAAVNPVPGEFSGTDVAKYLERTSVLPLESNP